MGGNFDAAGIGQGLGQVGGNVSEAVFRQRERIKGEKEQADERARQAKRERFSHAQFNFNLVQRLKPNDPSYQAAIKELQESYRDLTGKPLVLPMKTVGAVDEESVEIGVQNQEEGSLGRYLNRGEVVEGTPEKPPTGTGPGLARIPKATPSTVTPPVGAPTQRIVTRPGQAGQEISYVPLDGAEIDERTSKLIGLMGQDINARRAALDQLAQTPGINPQAIWQGAAAINQRVRAAREKAVQAGYSVEEATLMFPSVEQTQVEQVTRGVRTQQQLVAAQGLSKNLDAIAKEVKRYEVNRTPEGRVALERAMIQYNAVYAGLEAITDPASMGTAPRYDIAAELANWDKGAAISPKDQVSSLEAQARLAAWQRFNAGDRSPETLALTGMSALNPKTGKSGIQWNGMVLSEKWQVEWAWHNDPRFRAAFPGAEAFFKGGPKVDDVVMQRQIAAEKRDLNRKLIVAQAEYDAIKKVWDRIPAKVRAKIEGGDFSNQAAATTFGRLQESQGKLQAAQSIYADFNQTYVMTPGERSRRQAAQGQVPFGPPPAASNVQYHGPAQVGGFNVQQLWEAIRTGKEKLTPEEWNKLPPAVRTLLQQNGIVNGQFSPQSRGLDPQLQGLVASGNIGGVGFRVTSTTGGQHVAGSKHYGGRAVDIVPNLPLAQWSDVIAALVQAGYRVLDERRRTTAKWTGPHLHVEVA